MRRLTLTINDGTAQALVRLAQQERRRPQEQAAFLLERSLAEVWERAQRREVEHDGVTQTAR